ncbi:hypothetical protein PgNI_10873 [Pyricularia grisea]|uniref:Uncharacterized protein n=1 Tax=Pyricularia grisea TaxID=148305 RepID=A0A6P8AZN9_PYRGI|nr:hypothetical protein PgNI_10873 [Pyricularia grisea]TLD07800.1 hypothetical protein PgNI_10873 [Pyricularia grisea]
MPKTKQEIVIDIDFGTTFTRVAIHHGTKSSRHINNCPRTGGRHTDDVKVRTTILYDSTGKRTNWKYTIVIKEESLCWVRILLDSDSRYFDKVREIQEIRIMLQSLGKTRAQEEFYRQFCSWVDLVSIKTCIDDWRTVAGRTDYTSIRIREHVRLPVAVQPCGLSRGCHQRLPPWSPPANLGIGYGVPLFCAFEEALHLRYDRDSRTQDGKWMVVNQIDWLLLKANLNQKPQADENPLQGDTITEGRHLYLKAYRNIPFDEKQYCFHSARRPSVHHCDVKLLISYRDSLNTRKDDFCKKLITINFTLTTAQIREFGQKLECRRHQSSWRRIPYTIVVTLNKTHFDVSLDCFGQKITCFKIHA